jgi:arylsulfatase A-like enzyme
MRDKPNIILCTMDQLRAFEIGCYGNDLIQTPNMDRLAASGVRFETAVTNYPMCMAARSVLLSGQYNRTCTGGVGNVYFHSYPGDINIPQYPFWGRPHLKATTLPEILKQNGYSTSAIGKWHIHSWPHDVGFDNYLIPRVHHCHTGQHFTENGGAEFVAPGYSVDFESERVERFLEKQKREEKPFFLFYNISPPHCPLYDAPEKYLKMYDPESIPLRPNVDPDKPIPDWEHHFKVYLWDFRYYKFRLPHTMNLPQGFSIRNIIALYYGLTTWADDALGRMLDTLDKTGLGENTIVVFTSDHGDHLGSHGYVQKGSPLDESIRIPLILRLPESDSSPLVDTQNAASLVDVAPTLLTLSGIPIPSHIHGKDLSPYIKGKEIPRGNSHSFIETAQGAGIRTNDHLYFVPFRENSRELGDHPAMFYDLVKDPYQLDNLAEESGEYKLSGELDNLLREGDVKIPWMETS